MKSILLASTIMFVTAGSTLAADAVAPPSELAPAGFVWTGGYVGLQAGWQWGNDHDIEFLGGAPTGFEQDFDTDGFIGGVHAGYNWQSGQVVYGVEGDFEFSGVDGGYRVGGDDSTGFEMTWQASIRGRLGFVAMERLLVYGAVGAAFGNLEYTYVDAGTISETFDETKVGWTAGAGVEYALTDRITTRLEYRYTDFGSISNLSTLAFPGFTYEHDPKFHSVRVGLSYKF
ncbi:outer membrane protein A [Aminobacter sp. MSH1]|uniref:outer membrane protein n=1 Tax=Aminobacter sp. MSH1 TaxID=374606 RepID=UPI000D36048C|nr:outer membrane protein [Aminobacter sp. MSH1]AWC24215.1 outer membrane protein A [Aminobacter sp. MSH1]